MIGVKEIELLDAFCAFLDKKGIQYKREVRKRSYHNEGYCDVVIRSSDGRFMGIECKINGFGSLVNQVLCNRGLYHYNYALYPRIPRNDELLKECGLIVPVSISMEGFVIHRKVKMTQIAYYCMSIVKYRKTERNWNENRVGRLLHASEIPEGYSKDHLKPTFEWVDKCKGKRFDSP
jgi:hypothetical protein